MITMVVSAWSFLLTTMDGWSLNPKIWQESMSYFSTLLDKEDRSLRIAAGEAVALILEIGSLEKFCGENKVSGDTSIDDANNSRQLMHINGIKNKIINQIRGLSTEAGGKGTAKKDLNSQRNTFRDILDFIEGGYAPEASDEDWRRVVKYRDMGSIDPVKFPQAFPWRRFREAHAGESIPA